MQPIFHSPWRTRKRRLCRHAATSHSGVDLTRWAPVLMAGGIAFLAVTDGPAQARVKEDGLPPAFAVSLVRLAEEHGLEWVDDGLGAIELRRGGLRIKVHPGSRRVSVRGVLVWLHHPLVQVNGDWILARSDVETILEPLLWPWRHNDHRPVRMVLLDPGHGGMDGGAASAGGLLEKDVALDIAHRVAQRLETRGYRVRLTREEDQSLSLDERIRLAERWHADLFISVHLNGSHDLEARGIETYVLARPGAPSTNTPASRPGHTAQVGNGNDHANLLLGYLLQREMIRISGSVDRGLRHARFSVLRDAPCPAALIECGFLTNREDERKLRNPAHLDRLADGVAHAVEAFAREMHRQKLTSW